MPVLYLVATPIGNLEDITLRALRVLKEAKLIAAEDTRTTRKLLERYDILTPVTSYHEHNKLKKLPSLLAALAEKDIALVSDAGTPGINDPGYELVREAAKAGYKVVPIPGASAVTVALAASGLPAEQFIYVGFLPRRRAERLRLLNTMASDPRTLVAFETPHRLRAALEDALATLGDRPIAICRELTKLHEEIFRGRVSEALAHFVQPRGEFTLVIEGSPQVAVAVDMGEAHAQMAQLRRAGVGAREAVAQVSEKTGLPRREVYRMWLAVGGKGAGPAPQAHTS